MSHIFSIQCRNKLEQSVISFITQLSTGYAKLSPFNYFGPGLSSFMHILKLFTNCVNFHQYQLIHQGEVAFTRHLDRETDRQTR